MQRRKFISSSAAMLSLMSMSKDVFGAASEKSSQAGKTVTENVHAPGVQTLKPRALKKGDTIGLVAPGSYIKESDLKESVENIEKLGFRAVYTDNILARSGYLGGSDAIRAADLNTMFSREDVDGIICVRGGYGCQRILPMLDYELIRKKPKVLCGYSDITALLYALYSQAGLTAFHGPVATSTFNDFSVEYFNSIFVKPVDTLVLVNPGDEEDRPEEAYQLQTIRSGSCEGELIGGNLSIVVSLIGTKYDVDSKGKIIFLEEIGEEPYRVDRMLTQMIQAGKFEGAAGIALGVFNNCEPRQDKPEFQNSFSLKEVLYDRLYSLGIPVIYGLSFGHIVNKFTLPFGIRARLDAERQTMTLLEKAVR